MTAGQAKIYKLVLVPKKITKKYLINSLSNKNSKQTLNVIFINYLRLHQIEQSDVGLEYHAEFQPLARRNGHV